MASQRIRPSDQIELAANHAATRWKVLLAHDGALNTCDGLFDAVAEGLKDVQIVDAPSAESARSLLRRAAFDVCLVCLDLPPSPSGGIRLAQELVRAGCPLILVTRSLRWLPRSAAELKLLPWIPPEATPEAVARAVDEAITELDFDNQITLDSSEEDESADASIPQRISEI